MERKQAELKAPLDDRATEAGESQPEPPIPAHPESAPLFGGISGLALAVPEFALANGLVARETYAHVMAPYVVAFKRPEKLGAYHPGPWKAAHGGLGFDITIEI